MLYNQILVGSKYPNKSSHRFKKPNAHATYCTPIEFQHSITHKKETHLKRRNRKSHMDCIMSVQSTFQCYRPEGGRQ